MQYEAQNKGLENTQMLYVYFLFIYFVYREKKKYCYPGIADPPIDNRVANNDNCHYIELFAQSMKM